MSVCPLDDCTRAQYQLRYVPCEAQLVAQHCRDQAHQLPIFSVLFDGAPFAPVACLCDSGCARGSMERRGSLPQLYTPQTMNKVQRPLQQHSMLQLNAATTTFLVSHVSNVGSVAEAHVFWATRASLMANSEDRRRAVARSEVRVAVEGLCRTSFTSQEDLPALDPLADARGPEATVPVGADAEGAVAITVLGPGDPAPAYHYRQPFSQPLADTRKETGAVVTPRGVVASIGLRVRHRLVGCSKLCFSPIGAILVICSCSLLYCVAEIFSPPPFGINPGPNGAECNATGFKPTPICICVPRLL